MGDEGIEYLNGQVNKSGRPRKKTKLSINTGRKRINDEGSTSTLYRQAHEIISNYDTKSIELAYKLILKETPCEFIVKNQEKTLSVHSNESALAFYLDCNYNTENYIALVNDTRLRNCPIYCSYYFITEEMNKCKPEKYLIVTETEVTVSLQSMLNKTAERLCEGVAFNWEKSVLDSLDLVATVGFDSSSGHTNPHQKYSSTENINANSQQSLFVTSMITIVVRSKKSNENLWMNPKPQSVRFCGPLRIAFEKEDEVATRREFKRLNEEIRSLKPHNFTMPNEKSIRITFNVSQTLFDGKCVNTIVGNNATSRCPMCLRTTHLFGNLDDDFKPNEPSLKYGLGLLHCTIKCFEHLLHLSYKKDFMSWDVQKDKKAEYDGRKKEIKNRIYERIGVRVDQVLQGHGISNTGNVARRCFEYPTVFAEALKLDPKLLTNIATVLAASKCSKNIKLDELEEFCWETYCSYYKLYPRARMNPTCHKLLNHGCEIARIFSMPMIYFAEDGNESWHKLYRLNMTKHARQNSRLNRIFDVYNTAIFMTDPKISLLSKRTKTLNNKSKTTKVDITRFLETGQNEVQSDNGSVIDEDDFDTP